MNQVIAAARHLITRGAPNVLVKLGSRGSLLLSGDRVLKQPAFKVNEVVDTTGAGDTFTGRLIRRYRSC